MTVLDSGPNPSSAEAAAPTEVLVISQELVLELIESDRTVPVAEALRYE